MIATTTANPFAKPIVTPLGRPDPRSTVLALTGRPYLSHSQIKSYQRCPRQWFFSHVEKVPPAFIPVALKFGIAIHGAVQLHFERRRDGQSTPDAAALLEAWRLAWAQTSPDLPVQYGKREDEAALIELAARMLEAFVGSELADVPGDVVGVEQTLTASVHPDLPDLHGRLDVVMQDDEGLRLIDVKTSRSAWSDNDVRSAADQLLLYAELMGLADQAPPPDPRSPRSPPNPQTPRNPMRLSFGVITKARNPVVQVFDIPPTPDRARVVVDRILPVWRGMRLEVDFANPGPMNCPTCPYQHRCPASHLPSL